MLVLDKILSDKEIIQHLKNKNVQFRDEKKAEEILSRIGYFKLKEFSYVYRDNSKNSNGRYYKKGTYFENFYNDFKLDRELRLLMIEYIEIIEIYFKNVLVKILGKNYKYDYLNLEIWANVENKNLLGNILNVNKYLENKTNSILLREKKDMKITTIEYLKKNKEKLPIWVLMEEITLGRLIDIIEILKPKLFREIYSKFYSNNDEFIENFRLIKEIRNRSAHNNNLILERYKICDKEITILEVIKKIKYFLNKIGYDELLKLDEIIEKLRKRNDILSFYEG